MKNLIDIVGFAILALLLLIAWVGGALQDARISNNVAERHAAVTGELVAIEAANKRNTEELLRLIAIQDNMLRELRAVDEKRDKWIKTVEDRLLKD